MLQGFWLWHENLVYSRLREEEAVVGAGSLVKV